MTKGPMCVTSDTSATDALNLMVSRGFRHLVTKNNTLTFLITDLIFKSLFVTKRAIFLAYLILRNVYMRHWIRWKEHLVHLVSFMMP